MREAGPAAVAANVPSTAGPEAAAPPVRAASWASGLELLPPKDVTIAVANGSAAVVDCKQVTDFNKC